MNSPLGRFTKKIIVGNLPFKHIFLANQAKEELKIFREEVAKNKRKKVDTLLIKSLKIPKVRKVDVLISFNDLGYVKNIPKFVAEVKNILKAKGKFCFYVKSTFINVAPNAILVNDRKKLIAVFEKEKLKVQYRKRKRLYKTEIFVSGQKR